MKGRPKSDEHRKKISAAHKDVPENLSAEGYASKVASMLGNKHAAGGRRDIQRTPEYREKMRLLNVGKKMPQDAVERMRATKIAQRDAIAAATRAQWAAAKAAGFKNLKAARKATA